ncbi:acylneuraminate cytidylyltransferase family protein [Aquirufa aurantiipilula]|uniref:acylneuraminate cytidylyltransferase family protein n=1 Tax=Aquirufa aurantiipilula TaxID=2696561 RepID=UPI001CAA4A05|nr:acylneuraminate cytidylyltransferase family protein [Aquirufa aurantiipilula]MBZ1326598.1 acylneuraminate cytidylyltransferase family protein [Aquirufa aurantiipilula]
MEILITLCARGGSKGIPGKNIRLINGIPLIAYSIAHANAFSSKYKADIALSTDSDDIRSVAKFYGVETDYIRPENISLDSTGKMETISHILNFEENKKNKKYDFIIDLDISSPLRNLEDLLKGFEIIRNDEEAMNLFSVNPAQRNPYFNMVEKKNNGYFGLVKEGNFLTRQSAPDIYDLNASFYFFRRRFFDQINPKTINDKSLIFVMKHICFDLDHPIDFEFMEYLISNNKLDFNI